MNCPFHNLIFRSRGRSYRELPLRLFEFGSVYRYEKSGVVHGLTRVRGMTQDDAHIYCTAEQMAGRAGHAADVRARPAARLRPRRLLPRAVDARPREVDRVRRGVGRGHATALEEAATGRASSWSPTRAARRSTGPKISVQARDAIGRTWQMSTIQVDFNQPQRFGLEYQAADGTRQQPVMIHRALFGSIERFFARADWSTTRARSRAWLAPVQVVGIPIADAHVAVPARRRGPAARRGDPGRGRRLRRPDAEEDPQRPAAEGAVHADRRRRRRRGRRGVVPLPRRRQKNGVPVEEAVGRDRGGGSRAGTGMSDASAWSQARAYGESPDALPAAVDAAPHGLHPRGGQAGRRRRRRARSAGIPTLSDEDGLIVARGHLAYAVLNLYPYNPGHLMVCPVPPRGRLYTDARRRRGRRDGRLHAARDADAARCQRRARVQHRHEPGHGRQVPASRRTCTSTSCRAGAATRTSCRSSARSRCCPQLLSETRAPARRRALADPASHRGGRHADGTASSSRWRAGSSD